MAKTVYEVRLENSKGDARIVQLAADSPSEAKSIALGQHAADGFTEAAEAKKQ